MAKAEEEPFYHDGYALHAGRGSGFIGRWQTLLIGTFHIAYVYLEGRKRAKTKY